MHQEDAPVTGRMPVVDYQALLNQPLPQDTACLARTNWTNKSNLANYGQQATLMFAPLSIALCLAWMDRAKGGSMAASHPEYISCGRWSLLGGCLHCLV